MSLKQATEWVCLSHVQGSSWETLSTLKVDKEGMRYIISTLLHGKAREWVAIPPDTSSAVFPRLPHWNEEPAQKGITKKQEKDHPPGPPFLLTDSSASRPPSCLSSEEVGTPY